MGQPDKNQWQASLSGIGGNGSAGARLTFGAFHPLLNPVSEALGITAESFLDQRSSTTAGLRLQATSRILGLSAGLEQSLVGGRALGLAFSYQTAVRRGGILRRGTLLRADWLPRGDGSIAVGIQIPIGQPFAGITRERVTALRMNHDPETVRPSSSLIDPTADAALTRAAQAATQLEAFTNLYTPDAERTILSAPSRDYVAVLTNYHRSIGDAFRIAARDSAAGLRSAAAAKTIVLETVVIPFNSSFGQAKKGEGIGGLTTAASIRFRAWLNDSSSRVPVDRRQNLEAVFTRWLGIVEAVQADLRHQWKDTRMVWLPLQLGLTADEFDEQREIDDIISRLVGHSFSDGNGLGYLHSTELPLEIARTIYAARDYHVLWTHDFAGRRFSGAIDNIGYSMVADVYLPALTASVKRYDSTGVFPVYMIMLDEYFYEPNDGRLWMTMLENPLESSMDLGGDPERQAHLRERQRELRNAVASSKRMQADIRRGLNPRDVVKVHVNITFPADPSFRSKRIIPPVPFTPDDIMRDHRKIVFYDVNESDPYRGAMILMGVGIGEHYASPTWEDRGYRIRGPAALEARRALRRTLYRLGFTDDQIPLPLRPTAPPSADQQSDQRDYVGRAIQLHNTPGFGPKESSVGRAALYNLAAPGSTIIVPDPLWVSETWAGMLAAAAARGSKVLVIAPAEANAPSPQAPLMAMSREIVLRLIGLQKALAAQASAHDGELRVGLFAARAEVTDATGRAREIREGLQRAPWIRDVIPFDSTTLAVLENVTTRAPANNANSTSLARDEKPRAPQLHQKTQLIAFPGAMSQLLSVKGWRDVLAQSLQTQAEETGKFTEQLSYTTPDVDTTAMRRNDEMLNAYEQSRPQAERARVNFYFSVGSQNEDDRGLASDGEAAVIVSGYHAASGVVDLYNVITRSRWVTTPEEVDRYLPPKSSFIQRLGRWLKAAL
jgi:hypothetical protein